jgi:hypothetical protein
MRLPVATAYSSTLGDVSKMKIRQFGPKPSFIAKGIFPIHTGPGSLNHPLNGPGIPVKGNKEWYLILFMIPVTLIPAL